MSKSQRDITQTTRIDQSLHRPTERDEKKHSKQTSGTATKILKADERCVTTHTDTKNEEQRAKNEERKAKSEERRAKRKRNAKSKWKGTSDERRVTSDERCEEWQAASDKRRATSNE